MPAHRKLITMPALGERLLSGAASPGGGAQGEYLTTILRQRHNAWHEALSMLDAHEITRAEIRAALDALAGYEPRLQDRAGAIARFPLPARLARIVEHDVPTAIALCDLAQESNAANQALARALENEAP